MSVGIAVLETVSIPHADILTLPTAPVTVVAAPGAGFVVRVLSVTVVVDSAAGAYTNIDAAAELVVSGGDIVSLLESGDALTDLLTPEDVAMATMVPAAGAVVLASTRDNAAITLSIDNNAASDLEDGHADNTMSVSVLYCVVPV